MGSSMRGGGAPACGTSPVLSPTSDTRPSTSAVGKLGQAKALGGGGGGGEVADDSPPLEALQEHYHMSLEQGTGKQERAKIYDGMIREK